MNRKIKLSLILSTIILSMSLSTIASATSVLPVLYTDLKGDAETQCKAIKSGADYAYKIDGWGSCMDGTYGDYYGDIITIFNSDKYTFDWSCDYPVVAVIVKGGSEKSGGGSNVFFYDTASYSYTGLYAPLNPNTPNPDDTFEISHVVFCIDIPDFVIPETTIGTIGTMLAMLGAAVLLRNKPIFIK